MTIFKRLANMFCAADLALLALGRELEAALAAEAALDGVAQPKAKDRASEHVWNVIRAVGLVPATTDAGRLVKARAAARANIELQHIDTDDLSSDDERALAALVHAFHGHEV